LFLALPLGGCAGGVNPISVLTASVDNPIDDDKLAAIIAAYNTVQVPVRYYVNMRTCKTSETFVSSGGTCGEYTVKLKLQAATREAQTWRRELIRFVQENRQVDALTAYKELTRVLDILKRES
jgi:hypothetical protein